MPAIWWPHGYGPPDDEIRAGKTRVVRAGGRFDPRNLMRLSHPAVVTKDRGVWKAVHPDKVPKRKAPVPGSIADGESVGVDQRKTA